MNENKEEVSSVIDSGGGSGGAIITAPTEHNRIRINKWRVRVGYPVSASQVILLYEVIDNESNIDSDNKIIHKLKSNRVGVVKKRLYKDGDTVEPGVAILELSDCIHTTVIKDMCADCGADLRQNENGNAHEASVPMVHSIPDLKVTQKLAQKLGHDDTRRLLIDRKLVLLVDLDQTVIHTTNDNVPNNIKGIYHFQLYGQHSPWYHTRLRPGTPQFLERMSEFYELHICTFGARNYAHMIAQLLDPEGKFFSHRILSRDECFNATSKTDNLKALFPNGDSMVCIIDDREDVWNMASNLIQVKPYHFFQHTGDINAPPGLSKHELDGEGVDFQDLNNMKNKNDALTTVNKTEENTSKEENIKENDELNSKDAHEEKKSTEKEEISIVKEEEAIAEEEISTATEELAIEKKLSVENDGKIISMTESEPIESSIKVEEQIMDVTAEQIMDVTAEQTSSKSKTEVISESDPKEIKDNPKTNTNTVDSSRKQTKKKVIEKANKVISSIIPLTKIKVSTEPDKQIEIEDPDDYLLYLEVILKTIHTRFYSIYDDTQEIPDLKIIVPKIRSEVLRSLNLVFSGLVPTNMKLEQSRAYFIAKSLGANVTQNMEFDTTHLVAVTAGTFKVMAAKKNPQIKVVNANWLWTCAERWEHVEEALYPLDRKAKSKQRQPPAHCHSPEHVVNYSDKSEISLSSSAQQHNAIGPAKFIDTINPLLSFSNADLADMNHEFEQFFESDTSSEDEHVNIENPPVDKKLLKRKREEKEEERTRDFFTRTSGVLLNTEDSNEIEEEKSSLDDENEQGEDEDDDDDVPSAKFRRGENLPSDLEMGSDSTDSAANPDNEDDGEWNMMGAALEREFLGLED